MSKLKHPDYVEGWNKSLENLAKTIGNMRYDKISEFLKYLKEEFKKQHESDLKRGRKKLSETLYNSSLKIEDAENEIKKAWEISEPYM